VNKKEKFVQMGAVDTPRAVAQNRRQTVSVNLVGAFDLRAGQQCCLAQELIRFHVTLNFQKIGLHPVFPPKRILVDLSRRQIVPFEPAPRRMIAF
jgi:hypothetical protein